MRKERKKGFFCLPYCTPFVYPDHGGLPLLFEPPHETEPTAITVELLPISSVSNVKPSENTPAPKIEPKKEPEAKNPLPR